jgi:hypothetical protein
VDDYPPRDADDELGEDDDFAALAFYAPEQSDADPDELDDVAPAAEAVAEPADETDDLYFGAPDEAAPDDQPAVPQFTVTNPPGTVTVTTFMDGRVHEIDLSPKVTTLTESQLAEEIVVIARLATQDARAAQFSFMLEGMNQQGHDEVATRDFLNRDLDLPSPEQATAMRAEVFAQRYASDHE